MSSDQQIVEQVANSEQQASAPGFIFAYDFDTNAQFQVDAVPVEQATDSDIGTKWIVHGSFRSAPKDVEIDCCFQDNQGVTHCPPDVGAINCRAKLELPDPTNRIFYGRGNIVLTARPNRPVTVERDFRSRPTDAVVSIKMYDDGHRFPGGVAAVSDNSGVRHLWFGTRYDPNRTNDYYIYRVDNAEYVTTIPRPKPPTGGEPDVFYKPQPGRWLLVEFFITPSGSYVTVDKQPIQSLFGDPIPRSAMTELAAIRLFTFPSNTDAVTTRLRFDHLLVHNHATPLPVRPPILPGPVHYMIPLPAPQPTVSEDRDNLYIETSKYRLHIMKPRGTLSIVDRLSGRTIPSYQEGSFFDGPHPIRNLSYIMLDANQIVHVQGNIDHKTYTIYLKVLDQGILINISSTEEFYPTVKVPAVEYFYGLGEVYNAGNLYLNRMYYDPRFCTGVLTPSASNVDVARMRTPIVVSPQSRLGYACFDDKIKHLLYVYGPDEKFGIPNLRVLAMGLSQPARHFERAFAIFTGSDPSELYQNFHTIRKGLGYPVIMPHFEHYGLGYEIISDMGCAGTGADVLKRINRLRELLGFNVDYVVIGSGYWTGRNLLGCPWPDDYGEVKIHDPTTDSFAFNTNLYDPDFFRDIEGLNIKLLFGMRINLSISNRMLPEALENDYLLRNPDGTIFHNLFVDVGTHLVLLDTARSGAREWFLRQLQGYENVYLAQNPGRLRVLSGFKEDTMISTYQAFGQYLSENRVFPMLAFYARRHYLQRARNDYFSLASDIQILPGYYIGHDGATEHVTNTLDKALQISQQHAFSGYYAPGFEIGTSLGLVQKVGVQDPKMVLRAIQMSTFFPCLDLSKPLGNTPSDPWNPIPADIEPSFKDFAHLHKRLQKYLYDMVVEAYTTGIPLPIMPLVIQYPDDQNVYNLGQGFVLSSHDVMTGRVSTTEFMVGRALLVAPITTLEGSRSLYLPHGIWYDFFTGEQYTSQPGSDRIIYTIDNLRKKYPVFVKGGEPFILQSAINDSFQNRVHMYPASHHTSVYKHYKSSSGGLDTPLLSGTITVSLNGSWPRDWGVTDLFVTDATTGELIRFQRGANGQLVFNMLEDHSYMVELARPDDGNSSTKSGQA